MKKLFALCLFACTGCDLLFHNEPDGKFLDKVVNLEDFNSQYDDYNSNLAQNRYGHTHLIFSSKREKKDVLNLVYFPAEFSYDRYLHLKHFQSNGTAIYDYFTTFNKGKSLLSSANGNFNVYGPKMSTHDDLHLPATDEIWLFYADDASGNMDIKMASQNKNPIAFDIINSPFNDAYPTFSPDGKRIYFCSDRGGNYDIYELIIKDEIRTSISNILNPEQYEIKKVEELSSAYNDKCPYVFRNTMVFVSDRPGGQGGEDIYYATYENDKWTTPVNAGARVNTTYNEYRPILPETNFSYMPMIFSSNRPGGKGGYDLYMIGLK